MTHKVYVPKRSTLVITFVGPEGDQRWMGTYKNFKLEHPHADVFHVETLWDYKNRLIPLNNSVPETPRKEKAEPGTAINH